LSQRAVSCNGHVAGEPPRPHPRELTRDDRAPMIEL
jgi:hypothetical protein